MLTMGYMSTQVAPGGVTMEAPLMLWLSYFCPTALLVVALTDMYSHKPNSHNLYKYT